MVDILGATLKPENTLATATTGVAHLRGIDADGRSVLVPPKFIDIREYGLSSAASAATNTTAITTALSAAVSSGSSLFLADGEYDCNLISPGYLGFGSQVSIFANPGRRARLVKASADGNGLFQMSTATPPGYTALLRFSNITFQGFAGDTPWTFRGYDLARCLFDFCQFTGATTGIGLDMKGGIGNKFIACNFDGNATGVSVKKYTGGYDGWPNLTTFDQCQMTNNTSWGIDFDDGRMLIVRASDIEGNGTNGDANTGGVRSGSSVGTQGGLVSHGFQALNCWFESNAGNAAVQWASGKTTLRDCNFVANNNATYDTYASGGLYQMQNCDFENAKTNNHLETAGVSTGNLIEYCEFGGGHTIDAAKTAEIWATGVDNVARVRTNRIRDIIGGTGVQILNASNVLMSNTFTSGSADSWHNISAEAGAAGIATGSSLSNADLKLAPKGTGLVRVTNPQFTSKAAPSSAADTGVAGEIRFASGFLYVCVATNTWQRVAIATW